MQNRKKKKGSSKTLVAVVILVFITISTFAWHEYRTSKRDAAAAAQQIYED